MLRLAAVTFFILSQTIMADNKCFTFHRLRLRQNDNLLHYPSGNIQRAELCGSPQPISLKEGTFRIVPGAFGAFVHFYEGGEIKHLEMIEGTLRGKRCSAPLKIRSITSMDENGQIRNTVFENHNVTCLTRSGRSIPLAGVIRFDEKGYFSKGFIPQSVPQRFQVYGGVSIEVSGHFAVHPSGNLKQYCGYADDYCGVLSARIPLLNGSIATIQFTDGWRFFHENGIVRKAKLSRPVTFMVYGEIGVELDNWNHSIELHDNGIPHRASLTRPSILTNSSGEVKEYVTGPITFDRYGRVEVGTVPAR